MITALLLLMLAAEAGPAAHRSVSAFELPERDLFPESIAWDPADGSFYVGSMHHRKIVRIAHDGSVSDFIPSGRDGIWGLLGMKIDPKRRELWANACNLGPGVRPPMVDPDPDTAGRTELLRYDLRDGRLLARYSVPKPPPQLCFNDLAFSPAGDVYLSSGPAGIWVLRKGSKVVERFHEAEAAFGNGVAMTADGKTLFLAVHNKGVAAIDVRTKAMRYVGVPAGPHLMGIDGLYVHRGALIGVQNGTRTHRVVRAPLSADLRSVTKVEILDEAHPLFDVPTTGVIAGDTLYYVATSQLDSVDPQTNAIAPLDRLRTNVILKLGLE